MKFDFDDDLAGGGQHYCTECGRHFADDKTREAHMKTKVHKRRLKDLAQAQYSHAEAESGAGMTKEVLPPAHAPKAHKTARMDTQA